MDFDKAVLELLHSIDPKLKINQAVGNEDAKMSFRDEETYKSFLDRQVSGIQFQIVQDKRDGVITLLREKLGNNYKVYCSNQNFGYQPDEVTVLSTSNKFDALYLEGTNGINYDITVEDIVDHLKVLENEHPFILTGVGFDFLQGDFINPLTNIEQLAETMYEFCPDIVDQGTGTVAELANQLEQSNSFYYWWD